MLSLKRKSNISQSITPPLVVLILDGWGLAPSWGGNAIALAKTENFDNLWRNYPSTAISASGSAVGLPEGAPGNSEAGHLNIGAGRIVGQDIAQITTLIEGGRLESNQTILDSVNHAKKNDSAIHIMGLLTKTGTHADFNHLYALLGFISKSSVKKVYIHLFSDGRDSSPTSGIEYVDELMHKIKDIGVGSISSIIGRFYAMDRDNHWGRTARAYNALVNGEAEKSTSPREVFSNAYSKGVTDEFIEPKIILDQLQPFHPISDNDSIILFNFRLDRVRQIIAAFTRDSLPEFQDRKKLNNIYFCSFVSDPDPRDNVNSIFKFDTVVNPLVKMLSDNNLSHLHIAETEKYAHITYFLNGGKETPYPFESRILIPSLRVRSYDFVPKMQAEKITMSLVSKIDENFANVYFVNIANADMIGHTGNLNSAIAAVTTVDICLKSIVSTVLAKDGVLIVTADHGNVEQMVNPVSGSPDTEHTTNPVPFILVSNKLKGAQLISNGALCNIAPTVLQILNIQKPAEMNETLSLLDVQ